LLRLAGHGAVGARAAVQALGLPAARFHADVFVNGPAAGAVPA
jgi:hypothetical protein